MAGQVRACRGRVAATRALGPDILEADLVMEDPPALAFAAGQWVSVPFGPKTVRAYSIASTPQSPRRITLCADVGPGGIALSFARGGAVVVGMIVGGRTAPRWRRSASETATAAWLAAYLLLTYCDVIGFFNLGESARRIRLLIELCGAGGSGMTLAENLSRYNARTIGEIRLQRRVAGSQIREPTGAYLTRSPIMLTAARSLVWLKIAYLGARRERGASVP